MTSTETQKHFHIISRSLVYRAIDYTFLRTCDCKENYIDVRYIYTYSMCCSLLFTVCALGFQ